MSISKTTQNRSHIRLLCRRTALINWFCASTIKMSLYSIYSKWNFQFELTSIVRRTWKLVENLFEIVRSERRFSRRGRLNRSMDQTDHQSKGGKQNMSFVCSTSFESNRRKETIRRLFVFLFSLNDLDCCSSWRFTIERWSSATFESPMILVQ